MAKSDLAARPVFHRLRNSIDAHLTIVFAALAIARDVRARRMLAVHWGTFDLSDEPPGEPPVRLRREASRLGLSEEAVWVFEPGEVRRW